jgi:thioredoxin reductase (NADPH)
MQHNLRSVTVEQDSLGGTVAHFPRGKLVMTAPFTLPLVGKAKFTELSKEELIRFFEHVVRRTGLRVRFGERVDAVVRTETGFEVQTARTRYRTRAVLLAIGRRGTPRTLDVPGEEHSKVVYRLVDPRQYRGHHVLVVGGGDSALEAACSIADEPGTVVTLAHRSASFSRAKPQNRKQVQDAARNGRLTVVMSASVNRIGRNDVEYEQGGQRFTIENHAVVICAGGILPTSLLERIGVTFETKFGTA